MWILRGALIPCVEATSSTSALSLFPITVAATKSSWPRSVANTASKSMHELSAAQTSIGQPTTGGVLCREGSKQVSQNAVQLLLFLYEGSGPFSGSMGLTG